VIWSDWEEFNYATPDTVDNFGDGLYTADRLMTDTDDAKQQESTQLHTSQQT